MKASKTLPIIIGVAIVLLGIIAIAMLYNKPTTKTPVTTTPPATTQTPAPSSSTQQPAQSGTNTAAEKVAIQNFAFTPSSITVKVGTTVTWTNSDSVAHTVTADTSSSDGPASGSLASGDTYSFTFKKAGTYAYHCAVHPHMTGTVIVN